jgi:hypothetical protein
MNNSAKAVLVAATVGFAGALLPAPCEAAPAEELPA